MPDDVISPATDCVQVHCASIAGSWSATLDLSRGTTTWEEGGAPPETRDVDPATLAALRAEAASAHAEGAVHISEQFADGDVVFTLTLGGVSVVRLYETWGGYRCQGVQAIWEHVTRRPR